MKWNDSFKTFSWIVFDLYYAERRTSRQTDGPNNDTIGATYFYNHERIEINVPYAHYHGKEEFSLAYSLCLYKAGSLEVSFCYITPNAITLDLFFSLHCFLFISFFTSLENNGTGEELFCTQTTGAVWTLQHLRRRVSQCLHRK